MTMFEHGHQMPEFRQAAATGVEERGDGWTLSLLADARHFPGMAMAARRWDLERGASTPERPGGGAAERFLYVISGSGRVQIAGEVLEVGREDMVWLQPGDRFVLEAEAEPLAVLEATSSAG
jgi:quercetin dioxygenase-like cupin family protein